MLQQAQKPQNDFQQQAQVLSSVAAALGPNQ